MTFTLISVDRMTPVMLKDCLQWYPSNFSIPRLIRHNWKRSQQNLCQMSSARRIRPPPVFTIVLLSISWLWTTFIKTTPSLEAEIARLENILKRKDPLENVLFVTTLLLQASENIWPGWTWLSSLSSSVLYCYGSETSQNLIFTDFCNHIVLLLQYSKRVFPPFFF